MANKHIKVIGQILLAVGLTLTVGGLASFLFPNVKLRLFGDEILTKNDRVVWIIINSLIALMAVLLLRFSQKK